MRSLMSNEIPRSVPAYCPLPSAVPALPAPDRPLLAPFFVGRTLENVSDKNPRSDDVIRIDLARVHELLDFCNRHLGSGGHHRVEVARGAPVDQVAHAVALPGVDEGKISAERWFQ